VGFYALLASFTLAQSGTHAHDRELMIHSIANDISEILRVSQTNEPNLNERVRTYFSDFYKIVREPYSSDEKEITARIKTIDDMDELFDRDMLQYISLHPLEKERIRSFLAKMDRMESNYYQLIHSYNRTIPALILMILVLFSLFIGFLIGFVGKFNGNHIYITEITFVVISFVILNVIHDLDNPSIGFIRPDFQDLAEVMQTYHINIK
jgi:hypothetical protein